MARTKTKTVAKREISDDVLLTTDIQAKIKYYGLKKVDNACYKYICAALSLNGVDVKKRISRSDKEIEYRDGTLYYKGAVLMSVIVEYGECVQSIRYTAFDLESGKEFESSALQSAVHFGEVPEEVLKAKEEKKARRKAKTEEKEEAPKEADSDTNVTGGDKSSSVEEKVEEKPKNASQPYNYARVLSEFTKWSGYSDEMDNIDNLVVLVESEGVGESDDTIVTANFSFISKNTLPNVSKEELYQFASDLVAKEGEVGSSGGVPYIVSYDKNTIKITQI